jgi:hypothetical protein
MPAGIPPPPLNSPSGSYYWLEWYTQLTNVLNGTGYPWTSLNFGNSNIHDISTRHHNSLLQIQGGDAVGDAAGSGNAWHMTGAGYVTSGGVGTGMPSGWSITQTSTGVYTLTATGLAAPPAVGALATSNTSGVVVDFVDTSTQNIIIFHLVTRGTATPASGAFTFVVST